MKHKMIGKVFGRLTVVSLDHIGKGYKKHFKCKCACGKTKIIYGCHILGGKIRSCGCLARELLKAKNTTHGKTGTCEHRAWKQLRRRCLSKKDKRYEDYGGRGVTFCKRWLKFENFYADIGPRPSPKHSLDRIDNNGNYEPGNCRWGTRIEQANNTRRNRYIEINGETKTLTQWARHFNISEKSVRSRIKLGWNMAEAFTMPVRG